MIREMDFKRDMDGYAALIDVAFNDELKEEGRQVKQEILYTKKLYPLLWITRNVFAPFSDRFKFIFHGYVWEEKGRIVGSVNVNKSRNDITRWYISGVAVAPEFRRRGIARALVQNAIDFARKNGAIIRQPSGFMRAWDFPILTLPLR
jgi:ribosomal protein S18 acetylase RimI-like enzyme